ncbi:MAG: hypothetical protein ABIE70_06975 [bacterium]
MRAIIVFGVALCLWLVSCDDGGPIDIDFSAGGLSDLRWGVHELPLTITSKSDDLHFIVVTTETDFPGIYNTSVRSSKLNAILLPGEQKVIRPGLLIPGNYGPAEISITVYDVVDTLDVLMPKYIRWQKHRQVDYNPPRVIEPYRTTPIQLPPRVADHPYFDNELARLMLVLIDERKSVAEIAEMTGADSGVVGEVLAQLMSRNHVQNTDDGLRVLFPIISQEQVLATQPIIDDLVPKLVTQVKDNWDDFERVVDSLIAVGEMTADTNLTMDPGAALHHRFPTVGCLLLWNEWGRSFITRAAPLVIYDKTDPCDANIGTYMYAARATSEQIGEHYFTQDLGRGGYSMNYADWPLGIICEEQFLRKVATGRTANLSYDEVSRPVTHAFDSAVVRPAIGALAAGADSLLFSTYEQVRDLAVEHGHARLDFGQRYWFWNVVATRTLKGLVADGFVSRPESGHVRLQGYRPGIKK